MAAMKALPAKNVDEYIKQFPALPQKAMEAIRSTIKAAAPSAEETISYQMPAYKYNGPLVYFAAYDHHLGFYPTPSGIAAFKNELAGYKSAKGSVQFPLDKPMPLSLVKKIVQFRVKENEANNKFKTVARKSSKKTSDKKT